MVGRARVYTSAMSGYDHSKTGLKWASILPLERCTLSCHTGNHL
jgi:hypothetical protein